MDINIVLLLATLITATEGGDAWRSTRRCHTEEKGVWKFGWDRYYVSQDCPLGQELHNPFQKITQPSSNEKCFCTSGTSTFYECPHLGTHTNPNGWTSDFLFCWKNEAISYDEDTQDGRYLLSIPGRYVTWRTLNCYGHIMNEEFYTTPILKYHSTITERLKDPRCNHNARKQLREEEERALRQKRAHEVLEAMALRLKSEKFQQEAQKKVQREKERKRLHCNQKSHYTQFMRQRYKKSHR